MPYVVQILQCFMFTVLSKTVNMKYTWTNTFKCVFCYIYIS